MHLFFARSATVVAAFSLVAAAFLAAPIGAADATTQVTQTLNVADLTPCCGNPEPGATGVTQVNRLSIAGVGQADTFASTIAIPSSTSNSSADIRVVLSRGGLDYAECFLVAKHDDDDDDSSRSGESPTFKATIVKVTFQAVTVFQQLAGQCDVDLSTDGTHPGVPAVLAGDVATASSVVNSVRTEFLSGIFFKP